MKDESTRDRTRFCVRAVGKYWVPYCFKRCWYWPWKRIWKPMHTMWGTVATFGTEEYAQKVLNWFIEECEEKSAQREAKREAKRITPN